ATLYRTGPAKIRETMRGCTRGQIVDGARLANADVQLTAAYFRAADDLNDGRIPTHALDTDWARGDTLDVERYLNRALARHRVQQSLEELAPPEPAYAKLRDALAR